MRRLVQCAVGFSTDDMFLTCIVSHVIVVMWWFTVNILVWPVRLSPEMEVKCYTQPKTGKTARESCSYSSEVFFPFISTSNEQPAQTSIHMTHLFCSLCFCFHTSFSQAVMSPLAVRNSSNFPLHHSHGVLWNCWRCSQTHMKPPWSLHYEDTGNNTFHGSSRTFSA